jgi:hypothetical protein
LSGIPPFSGTQPLISQSTIVALAHDGAKVWQQAEKKFCWLALGAVEYFLLFLYT